MVRAKNYETVYIVEVEVMQKKTDALIFPDTV